MTKQTFKDRGTIEKIGKDLHIIIRDIEDHPMTKGCYFHSSGNLKLDDVDGVSMNLLFTFNPKYATGKGEVVTMTASEYASLLAKAKAKAK